MQYALLYANGANASPCKGCLDRKVGCHTDCQAYIKYSLARTEMRKKDYVPNSISYNKTKY